MSDRFFDIQLEFSDGALLEADVSPDGFEQLASWIDEAFQREQYPKIMALATSTFEGKPSVRQVFLKGYVDGGLCFFSNYESKKGKQLLQNPYAAASIYWPILQRQVRIEGVVSRMSKEMNDEYFAKLPEPFQLAAWAFPQSQPVPSRKYLETLLTDFREEFVSKRIQRPDNWGGYILEPELIELWQGRPNGMYDRLQYTLFNGEWQMERLAP